MTASNRAPLPLLIFLDIDGVLRRTDAPLYVLERSCRDPFENVVRQLPRAKIVITSSWRDTFSLEEIRSHFSSDVAARIVGVIPSARTRYDFPRYEEVLSYLRSHGAGESPWIAIEDDPSAYPKECEVLLINPARGFDEESASTLLRMAGPRWRSL